MSTEGQVLHHPANGSAEQTWDGFSWPAFFFGSLWMLAKGLYGHFLITLLLIVLSGGFAAPIIWIVYGFIGNGLHKSSLLKKGYLTGEQWRRRDQASAPTAAPAAIPAPQPVPQPAAPRDHVTQLKELAELRDRGMLTEEEFAAHKAKLLGT